MAGVPSFDHLGSKMGVPNETTLVCAFLSPCPQTQAPVFIFQTVRQGLCDTEWK